MEKSINSRDYAVFLECLKRARVKANLTQEELAAKIGESQSFVSKCERGERRLDLAEARVICNALGVSLARFARDFEKAL